MIVDGCCVCCGFELVLIFLIVTSYFVGASVSIIPDGALSTYGIPGLPVPPLKFLYFLVNVLAARFLYFEDLILRGIL